MKHSLCEKTSLFFRTDRQKNVLMSSSKGFSPILQYFINQIGEFSSLVQTNSKNGDSALDFSVHGRNFCKVYSVVNRRRTRPKPGEINGFSKGNILTLSLTIIFVFFFFYLPAFFLFRFIILKCLCFN